MINKGRNIIPRGELHGNASLTKANVMKIKELRKIGLSQQKIAEMFNVRQTTISAILLGKTWKHLIEI